MTDLRSRVRAFLEQHDTLTLATVDPDGAPWTAAVFYAADDRLDLYFLSSPDSRHARALETESRVAATIQSDGQPWKEIAGLQIEGRAGAVLDPGERARVKSVYAERFEFVRDAPDDLRDPLEATRFYVLRPTLIRLIDNRLGFGHSEELEP